MYNDFDRKLSARIKDVFEEYTDDGADAGWAMMQSRLAADPPKVRSMFWYKATAAAVIVIVGAWGLLSLYQPAPVRPDYVKTRRATLKNTTSEPDFPASENQNIALPQQYSNHNKVRADHRDGDMADGSDNTRLTASVLHTEPAQVPLTASFTIAPTYSIPDSIIDAGAKLLATTAETPKAVTMISEEERHRIQGEKLARLEQKGLINSAPATHSHPGGKGQLVDLAVTAGSFVNYGDGSRATVNPSMGLSSEIKLTKKLKLATGLILAQNNLSYRSTDNAKAEAAIMNAVERPAMPAISADLSLLGPQVKARSYAMSSYDASLTGVDIPLNIKYMISENKNDVYVSAGVSSNYFFNENYTYKYQTATYGGTSAVQKATNEASSFNFARMLNFSVGLGYPVGRKNKISFEPYVKYPLGDMGTQNLQFGSAGMNLKFNFGSSR